jgi:hypothetical protein
MKIQPWNMLQLFIVVDFGVKIAKKYIPSHQDKRAVHQPLKMKQTEKTVQKG